MTRLLVHVEGQTEESFVNELLAPHLLANGYSKVSARIVGNARRRDRRGGIVGWNTARAEILRHLKGDAGCVATTMVDYYALPKSGDGAWPGRAEAVNLPYDRKALTIQDALSSDVIQYMGDSFDSSRFIPFVTMYEFEGLLFSDCNQFAQGIGRQELTAALQAIRDQFGSPEEINDSPNTAPSKRLEALVPDYEKPLFGTLAAIEVGLVAIRRECPHFHDWLLRLGC